MRSEFEKNISRYVTLDLEKRSTSLFTYLGTKIRRNKKKKSTKAISAVPGSSNNAYDGGRHCRTQILTFTIIQIFLSHLCIPLLSLFVYIYYIKNNIKYHL